MKTFYKYILIISSFTLITHCGVDVGGVEEKPQANNSTNVKDGGTYNPTNTGTDSLCEKDTEGQCLDETDITSIVHMSNLTLDFGFSEVGNQECGQISIPQGMVYQAEIDTTTNAQGESSTSLDSDGLPVFAPTDASGAPQFERTSVAQGTANLCYLRSEMGSHHGSIIISFKNPESENWEYVVTATLSGETGAEPFWMIESPLDHAVYDQREGHNDGVDDTEGDILINAKGSIPTSYHSILKEGLDTPIHITSDTIEYTTHLNENGGFAQTLALPQTPGQYSVRFSAETNRNTTISKLHNVIVASAPKVEILIKDSAGNDVSTAIPTDLRDLILGVRVSNLDISGPNQNDFPVELLNIQFNDQILVDQQTLWYDKNASWCSSDSTLPTTPSNDYTGFSSSTTFCLPLSEITNVQSGINQISVTAKNNIGEETSHFSLIVDYDKPIITIESPVENDLFSPSKPSTNSITLTGTVQNFVGTKVSDNSTSSYCDGSKSDSCVESSIKLWFNRNTSQSPVYIYPAYDALYANKTYKEINDLIRLDHPEQCRSFDTSENRFAGDAENTSIDSLKTIKTEISSTNSAGVISTTVYTTNTEGTITQTLDGVDISIFDFVQTETNSKSVTISSDGSIITQVYDAKTDTTTTYTTNGRTGAITIKSQGTECNIPKATFSITLSKDQVPLNLFTNIIEMRAQSVSGHQAIALRTFQLGITQTQNYSASNKTLTLAGLGTVDPSCTGKACVEQAPVMIHISEGTFKKSTQEGQKIATALEYILNAQMPFENIANGWPLPTTEQRHGEIDLEKSFKEQFNYPSEKVESFPQLDLKSMQLAVYQGLHKQSMAEKYLALENYRLYRAIKDIENNTTSECSVDNSNFCFFEKNGNPIDENIDKAYNVARDTCGETITSAFVPLSDLKPALVRSYTKEKNMPYNQSYWPKAIAGDNLEFNDFESGKWVVDQESIEFKPNGRLDVKVCVLPDEDKFTKCDDDVSEAKTPAFKGSAVVFNLIKGGLLGNEGLDDFTAPVRWNVGKIVLDLKDICLGSAEMCDPANSDYDQKTKNNILNLDMNKITNGFIDILNPESTIDSISLIPFQNCRDDYKKDWIKNRKLINQREGKNLSLEIKEENYPIGCNEPNSGHATFPVVIERNANDSKSLETWVLDYNEKHPEQADWLLHTFWDGIEDTFAKIITCMDNEMVNPVLGVNNTSFGGAYPDFIYEKEALSTDFESNNIKGSLNAKQSDLIIDDHGFTARLAMSLGVTDINLTDSTAPGAAFTSGHLKRNVDQSLLDDYPLLPESAEDAYFSASLNLEEFFNAASYLIAKKGPMSWLDTLGVGNIEHNGVDTATVNAVTLGQLGICENVSGGLLDTNLPPGILFGDVAYAFESGGISLDLILDKDHPVTLAMAPYTLQQSEGNEAVTQEGHATELKIGLTNIQASFKNFSEVAENQYTIGDEVLRLRFDAVLSVILVYHPENRKIHVFFPSNQNYHLSVVPGHSGPTYDDAKVVSTLNTLFGTVFAKFEKGVTDALESNLATAVIQLAGQKNSMLGDGNTALISLANLMDFEFTFNMDPSPNGECTEGQEPQYYNATQHEKFKDLLSRKNFLSPIQAQAKNANNPPRHKKQNENHTAKKGSSLKPKFEIDTTFKPVDQNTLNMDPCFNSHLTGEMNGLLCDNGIDDIIIDPILLFDSNTGYIHLGGKANVNLEKWLEENL